MRHLCAVLAVLVCASCGTDTTSTPATTPRSTTTGPTEPTASPPETEAREPGVAATPPSQSPGGRVSVSVAGHCSNLRIGIYLETEIGTPDSPIIGETTTTSGGSATVDVVVPDGTEPGRYRLGTFYLDAPDECRNRKADVPFDVR